MSFTLDEVDPDNLTTVLWSYNDSTGTNNPGGVITSVGVNGRFDLSAPNVTIDNTDRNDDGSPDVTFSYDDIVKTTFGMRMSYSSYAVGRAALGTLQTLLSKDGVVKF